VKIKEDDGSDRFLTVADARFYIRVDVADGPPINFCKTHKTLDTGTLLIWGKIQSANPQTS